MSWEDLFFVQCQLNGPAASEPHCEHVLVCSQHKSFMNLFAFKSMLPLKNRQRSCMRCGPTGVQSRYHLERDEEFLLLCTSSWWASCVPEIQVQPYLAHMVSWALDEVFQRVLCSFLLWGQLLDLALCCLTSLPVASCLGDPRVVTSPGPAVAPQTADSYSSSISSDSGCPCLPFISCWVHPTAGDFVPLRFYSAQ